VPEAFRYIFWAIATTGDRRKPANNIARIRALLAVPLIPIDAMKAATTKPQEPKPPEHPCRCCGSRMRIVALPGQQPKHRPTPLPAKIRIDTS
jgi:hypothetical protein